MPQNATSSLHIPRPGAATSRQPRRRGLPPGTAAVSKRPHGHRVTTYGCRTNDPSCVSCGVRVCACSVHSRVVYCTYLLHCFTLSSLSYTLLHYFTQYYTILHDDTLSYTILHYTLLYTILHYFTLCFSHFWIMWRLLTSMLNQERRN